MPENADGIRVEVIDPGDGFEPPERLVPDLTKTGGLGLVLVDRLSRAWGTQKTSTGSLVWFELAHDRDEWRIDANPA
jgi:anti-sigma regulatory factor (Ser/Thr protein kinase)